MSDKSRKGYIQVVRIPLGADGFVEFDIEQDVFAKIPEGFQRYGNPEITAEGNNIVFKMILQPLPDGKYDIR